MSIRLNTFRRSCLYSISLFTFSNIPRYLSRSSTFCPCIEISSSIFISELRRATFPSIIDTVDARTSDLRAGVAPSSCRSGYGRKRALAVVVFTSLPQLMQVVLSPRRTWTPLHLVHGSLVRVPPFAKREAPVLILLTFSSEEVIAHY
jgi:hypothetical protein